MKKFRKPLGLFCLCIIFMLAARSQTTSFDNVVSVKLQNVLPIINNKDIVGYAFVYKVDKLKNAALYRLEILDENLKSIGNNEFEAGKNLEVVSAEYESGTIMLAMEDKSKNSDYEKYVMTFDLKGKKTGTVGYERQDGKKGMFGKAIAESMGDIYNGFLDVEGKGFVALYPSDLKTGGATIQFIGLNGRQVWLKDLTADKGDRVDMYLLHATTNSILYFCSERENLMAKDSKNFLVGLDPATGKQLFKKSMDVGSTAFEPYLFKTTENGGIKMFSFISDEDDKFFSARIKGFSISDFDDKTGTMSNSKNYTYESELSKVIDMKSDTKTEEGYMRIHNAIFMKDGSTVLVGEFFRRTVSALGVASKLLSRNGGIPVTQISIGDMFLLRLSKEGKVNSLEKIEKRVDRVPVPGDGVSLGLISRWLAQEGFFGYSYTDESGETDKVTVVATGAFEGDDYGTTAITFGEKKGFKVKNINPDKEKGVRVYVRRGKPGHLMIIRHSPKKKQITTNLEKIN